jgi:FkbM family methyltransferase
VTLLRSSGYEGLSARMNRRLAMLRFILDHRSNRHRRAWAIGRWAGWQVWRRTVRRPVTVRFWNGLSARVYPDWPYSWTAIYVGLTEYDEMNFTLRYLRGGDAFVDVGANVGFYSLLAAHANQCAPVIAFEPHPTGAERLRENASINSMACIRVVQAAAGDRAGQAMLTPNLADQNRIEPTVEGSDLLPVPVVTVDAEIEAAGIDPRSVALVKVDTEGFEARVLAGAAGLIEQRPGPVWMVELTGLGRRYGAVDADVRRMFSEHGYHALRYDADANRLVDAGSDTGNILFARDPEAVASRLETTASQHKPAVP